MSNIETMQIVGGGNLENAFIEFGVNSRKLAHTYHEFGLQYGLQVWELTKEEFDKFNELTTNAKDWNSSKLGWFRLGGVNVSHNDVITFEVNGKEMLGFKNEYSYYHSEEFLKSCEEDGEEPYIPGYCDLLEYLESYWGASKNENVALFINELSEVNELSKADFVKQYANIIGK